MLRQTGWNRQQHQQHQRQREQQQQCLHTWHVGHSAGYHSAGETTMMMSSAASVPTRECLEVFKRSAAMLALRSTSQKVCRKNIILEGSNLSQRAKVSFARFFPPNLKVWVRPAYLSFQMDLNCLKWLIICLSRHLAYKWVEDQDGQTKFFWQRHLSHRFFPFYLSIQSMRPLSDKNQTKITKKSPFEHLSEVEKQVETEMWPGRTEILARPFMPLMNPSWKLVFIMIN